MNTTTLIDIVKKRKEYWEKNRDAESTNGRGSDYTHIKLGQHDARISELDTLLMLFREEQDRAMDAAAQKINIIHED